MVWTACYPTIAALFGMQVRNDFVDKAAAIQLLRTGWRWLITDAGGGGAVADAAGGGDATIR